jgi:hypothetical protein
MGVMTGGSRQQKEIKKNQVAGRLLAHRANL